MPDNYADAIRQAETHEQNIQRLRSMDDPPDELFRRNFISKAQGEWLDMVDDFRQAMGIYRRFNQRKQAIDLLLNLFDSLDSSDEFSSLFDLRLLLTLTHHAEWLDMVRPGTRTEIKSRLNQVVVNAVFVHFEPGFWLIGSKRPSNNDFHRSALEFLRDLSDDEQDIKAIDQRLCGVMNLAAQFNIAYGNLDGAIRWYRDAAEIAQERLGDTEFSGNLLEQAANIHRSSVEQPPSEAFVQAMQADVNSPEYAEAMQRMSVIESLNVIALKEIQRQHQQRFLPTPVEFDHEYALLEDKLALFVADERLWFKLEVVQARAAEHSGKGIVSWLTAQDIDGRFNPRHQFETPEAANEYRFGLQYLNEVIEVVEYLFHSWMKANVLEEEKILGRFRQSALAEYDWLIFQVGLARFFEADFVAAPHLLIPQFENIVRERVRHVIPMRRRVGGVSGDLPLNTIVEIPQVREFLGDKLTALIDWYMVKSYGPYNYRHKIAHGWINRTECNFALSAMTIYLSLAVVSR